MLLVTDVLVTFVMMILCFQKPVNTNSSACRVRKEILPFTKLNRDQAKEIKKTITKNELSHINYLK